ncbi:MAG: ABC transporter ATP-binding protein [Lactococcus cremoris]|jgi:ABC-2 type transport system ATP-binding protein|uniref:ABC transporter ATP-binding protein n=1 Tax=Lactococcus lactis subsp. cremoris TaxID=1359 RepID=UPI000616E79F|nr:ABC transporter ATP-binding protein [Lactococcus cremoris]MCI1841178.1 ABC transporter ATP-binding protein [Lactococcus lactis]KZK11070.1 ABC transporter ATP-binding protein [Lactococcus cremoris]MCT0455771.1 ATP-binding cassette domain-containing protein [Lactococcus cremoris]MCT0475432.1 ATP-binding cassette domain-containing protein [Lactococcus cremoris]MCT0477265.1 ATP-binding cassette domain-containing protein [Lactococcus cremoris]
MTLKIDKVRKNFGDKIAVDNLNMVVKPGEVMGLIGQNGAGKTTTFRMILNFISADQGRITWQDGPINQEIKQKIGFLPEERGLYQKMTVEDQILYFAELHGMKRADARLKLQDWMKRLEVVGKPMDKVQTLSKGNAQKIQFIATLIHEPEFLILDEPFTGLDPVNTELLRNEIKRSRDKGSAVIFSNHNMSDVELLSDHLLMLKGGQTILNGTVVDIRASYGRTRVYLESDLSNDELSLISGVESIEKRGSGRSIKISEANVGREIFQKVAKDGYVQAFVQSPPSLDEIFRMEVAEHDQEDLSAKSGVAK